MTRIVPEDSILIPIEAKQVYRGKIFDVYQWQQQLFDGTTETYEMIRRPDTVVIAAIKDGKLVVINEQQSGRPPFTRLPGGRVESGEDRLVAAKRELLEETGLQFKNWRLVRVEQVETKFEWFVAVYLAQDALPEQKAQLGPGEKISVTLKSLDELKALIKARGNLVMKYSGPFFSAIDSMQQLQDLPEFRGKSI